MRLLSYALLLLIGACGTASEPGSETTSTTEETTTTAEGPSTTDVPTSMELPDGFAASLLEEIIDDAARRTGVSQTDIEVASLEERTFNDAALGCPEPGQMYAQVLTPGFVILIEAGGEELDYRVAERSEAFKLCE